MAGHSGVVQQHLQAQSFSSLQDKRGLWGIHQAATGHKSQFYMLQIIWKYIYTLGTTPNHLFYALKFKSTLKKGSPVHVALTCARSGEGSDHFGYYVCNISLHFCKRLFSGLEPMTSWTQGNSFTAAPGLQREI
jgi:hypothetical protein